MADYDDETLRWWYSRCSGCSNLLKNFIGYISRFTMFAALKGISWLFISAPLDDHIVVVVDCCWSYEHVFMVAKGLGTNCPVECLQNVDQELVRNIRLERTICD